ncbi:hypothetical protein B0H14DRAFT_3028676, partial [Mycena olivaceomarginata]
MRGGGEWASRTWSILASLAAVACVGGARVYEGGERRTEMAPRVGEEYDDNTGSFLSLGQDGEGVDRPAPALVVFGPLAAEEETLCGDDD